MKISRRPNPCSGYGLACSTDGVPSRIFGISTVAAVARQLEVVDCARDEMQDLAKDLGVQCVASVVLGDDIVLLVVVGSARPLSRHVQPGQRIPLALSLFDLPPGVTAEEVPGLDL